MIVRSLCGRILRLGFLGVWLGTRRGRRGGFRMRNGCSCVVRSGRVLVALLRAGNSLKCFLPLLVVLHLLLG